ncbi:alanine/glycine:cation symporter family protein [Fulvivirga kasyanovii]|uniref:Alanine:cation symporter family protein n=1 Tax=Fulvivirga kasyanovii TaxID=396812 RepID=A0ABW9RX74_9BACT|nr:alanine/glycine:cation symporter family protein [Fulvivirga kasyanovii]MTI28558.1 alanine:cation symporter family protein [Fulvivirga kasyanovii]
MKYLESVLVNFANWIWGMPLLMLLMGGGLFFVVYSRFIPFKYFFHAIDVLRGKYDDPNDPGQINHYEALSTALAATVGMGNISGVAVAIAVGGPGAIFWMWISAFVGMATKFFTCTLSILYRGKDSAGEIQGGPMYVIMEGLGKGWKPLAVMFAVFGLIGCLPIFQANQLTQAIQDIVLIPNGIKGKTIDYGPLHFVDTDLYIGLAILVFVCLVIFGGIKRIGKVAGKMVPVMVVFYFISVVIILLINIGDVPRYLGMIITNAFTADNYNGDALLGGTLGGLIVLGARRAAFSNEAGIGTAPMAHGAAKTMEPVREGLVAMLGPFIDTIIVCTLTALAILITGVWQTTDSNGVTLTANAFESAFPGFGHYILMVCILIFSITSLFSYSYYGTKCMSFLIGADKSHYYNYIYVVTILYGAISSLAAIISLIDSAFALMSIPTVTSALILAPKVKKAADEYFRRLNTKG